MAHEMQGSRIRLISKSEIRYEGTLSSIDPVANTVALKNVRMYGTENRIAEHKIPESDSLYDYIVFRGSDIKDLTVYESKKKPAEFVDPAVVSARPAARPSSYGRSDRSGYKAEPSRFVPPATSHSMYDRFSSDRDYRPPFSGVDRGAYGRWAPGGGSSYGRYDNWGGKGGYGSYSGFRRTPSKTRLIHDDQGRRERDFDNRRAGRPRSASRSRENPLAKHTGMNFKAPEGAKKKASEMKDFDFDNAEKIDMEKVKEEVKEKIEETYDKKKSFFDSLSCETTDRKKGESGRLTKAQRDSNHKHDIETFGADAVKSIERSFSRPRRRSYSQGPYRSNSIGRGRAYPPRGGGRGIPGNRGGGRSRR